ncbi:MAG: amidase [Acidobacteriota bacterium]|nr:amidase [Acidobacteriota bacterium]
MSTFISRLETSGGGVRLAVKDVIDVAGVPTTAGCRAVADEAGPAAADAACLRGARELGARIVGKTNLHELALGVTGENPWFGTPANPVDGRLVPGGSSSGSAVAVATGEADVALGTDTGGSVRIPSACCATAGLKTTHGRVRLDGVWPLAPSFDTVGPMARDVAGLELGMALLEPGFEATPAGPLVVGRVRAPADPRIDEAVDGALAATGWEVIEVEIEEWEEVNAAAGLLLVAEAWALDGALVDRAEARIGPDVVARLRLGAAIDETALASARGTRARWTDRLAALFGRLDVLAMPTLTIFPPLLGRGEDLLMARCTLPANLGGGPALSLPVPSTGPVPASLQLMGPAGAEARLLGAGRTVEAAVSR